MILCIICKAMTWISTRADLFIQDMSSNLRSVMSPYTPHFVPGFTETEVLPPDYPRVFSSKLQAAETREAPFKKHPTRGC